MQDPSSIPGPIDSFQPKPMNSLLPESDKQRFQRYQHEYSNNPMAHQPLQGLSSLLAPSIQSNKPAIPLKQSLVSEQLEQKCISLLGRLNHMHTKSQANSLPSLSPQMNLPRERLPLINNRILKNCSNKNELRKNLSILQNSGDLSTLDSSATHLFIGKDDKFKKKLKKPSEKNKKYSQVSLQRLDHSQQSSEQEQYQQDATPGPGSYSLALPFRNLQFRSQKESIQKIFISGLQRFNSTSTLQKENLPISIEIPKVKQQRGCQSFLSKSPKFSKEKEIDVPPPGHYYTRDTLQHSLVRNILKSSNTNVFITQAPRLPPGPKAAPGPADYITDYSELHRLEEKDKLSYFYKPSYTRECEKSLNKTLTNPEPCALLREMRPGKGHILHQKDYGDLQDTVEDSVPFMSKMDRFPKSPPKTTDISMPPSYNLQAKKEMNKHPFNSSSTRRLVQVVGEGVGVGLYDPKKNSFGKSFNVLYNT